MADANYTALSYAVEDTYGVPPSVDFTLMRLTGESLSHAKETTLSEELRADRQRSGLIEVGAMAKGAINLELSQGEYQPFLLAMLGQLDWTTVNVTATATASLLVQTLVTTGGGFSNVPVGAFVKVAGLTASANNGIKRVLSKSGDNNTLYFAAGSFTADQVGASVTITGKDARNGVEKTHFTLERDILAPDGQHYYQTYTGMSVDEIALEIASKAIVTGNINFMGKVGATSLNSANSDGSSFAATDLTFGATDPSPADDIVIGNRTFTLVSSITTATADQILIDSTPANMALNFRNAMKADAATYGITHTSSTAHTQVTCDDGTGALVTIMARRFGAAGNLIATTTTGASGAIDFDDTELTGGSDASAKTPATTNPVLNGTSNVGYIFQGDKVAVGKFKSLSMSVKNNIRGKDALGEKGAFELGWGTIDVTGKLMAYFRSNEMYQSLIDHTYTAIAFVLTGADGKSLAFTFPYVNFGVGDPNATGINTDVMLSPDFTAVMHPDLGCTIIVNAFDS